MSDHRPIRFGYHGSAEMPREIAAAAGRGEQDYELFEYDVSQPFRELRSGDLDVMIVKFTPETPDLVCSAPVAGDVRAAVISANHPLAGQESVSIEDFADCSGFRCPGTMPMEVWDEVVPRTTPSGRPIHREFELTSTADLMELVASSAAIHITVLSLAEVAPPSVRVVPIHDLPPAPVSLARLRGNNDPRVADFVRDAELAAAWSVR
jgi:DNA-binding transcriptional LysR family regulator